MARRKLELTSRIDRRGGDRGVTRFFGRARRRRLPALLRQPGREPPRRPLKINARKPRPRFARRLWLSQPFPFSNSRTPFLAPWLLAEREREFRVRTYREHRRHCQGKFTCRQAPPTGARVRPEGGLTGRRSPIQFPALPDTPRSGSPASIRPESWTVAFPRRWREAGPCRRGRDGSRYCRFVWRPSMVRCGSGAACISSRTIASRRMRLVCSNRLPPNWRVVSTGA